MFIDLVEWLMRKLSEFNFDSFVSYYPYILIFSLLVLIYAVYTSRNESNDLLEGLNLTLKDKKLRIRKRPQYLELSNLRPETFQKSFWRNHFEILGTIFNTKFIDVMIVKGIRPKVRLFYDNLPKLVEFKECPTLEPMQSWVGKNQFGDDVIIDLQSTPAIYLDGRPGSGKTIALMAILQGYLKGVRELVDVVIVTSKPADFYKLRKNNQINLKIIDVFEECFQDQVENILKEFELIKEIETTFKIIVEENNIDQNAMNLESLRQQGICDATTRKFFIFDEAKDYLAKNKADSKKEAQTKQLLISAVYTHIRRTARFLSIPIIIASQTQNESDLDIPIKMFHLRLASSTNEAMSRLICGDKRLTDLSFTKGKFFLKTDASEHIVKVPLTDSDSKN